MSGEHTSLPQSELKAILKAEGYRHRVLETLPQVTLIEANIECVQSIVFRAAMTRICNLELLNCEATSTKIFDEIRSLSFENFVKKNQSFQVRIRRIGKSAPHLHSKELESKIGEEILSRVKEVKVNLRNPDETFFGVLTAEKFVFGLKLAEVSPKSFMERRPRKRPFFHPSAMSPKLARCMVNMAQTRVGDFLLDPFCGTSSLLIEGGLIGCRVIGFDVQKRMVKGSLRNLLYYRVKPEAMGVADARNLPLTEVQRIVTDPPYGRCASTMGQETKQIVQDFFENVKNKMPRGGRICIGSPRQVKIGRVGKDFGFKCAESHFVYVHRSLTREIAVLERV